MKARGATGGLGRENTTLAVVATNARLNKVECTKLAQMAHHGLVRAISPVHTSMDGDLAIAMSCGDLKASPDDKLSAHFANGKARWRKAYDMLAAKISKFGADTTMSPNRTYINVQRGGKKFAILQPSTAERFDIGIKLKGVTPTERFEASGSWNNMVTHRVRISDPKEIDAEVLAWLKQAYDAA